MKKFIFTAVLLAVSLQAGFALSKDVPSGTRRTAREEIAENPYRAGGVYYTVMPEVHPQTKAPKGYEAFHLSSYNRHGARYILSADQNNKLPEVLGKAHSAGLLTPFGEDVYSRVMSHYGQTRYHEGDLSSIGWAQERLLGRQVYGMFPDLFRSAGVVEAQSSMVMRCAITMSAFCSGVQQACPSLDIQEEASLANLQGINPHAQENPFRDTTLTKAGRFARKDPWGGDLKTFLANHVDYMGIAARLFKNPGALKKLRNPMYFALDLYNFVLNAQCTSTGVDLMDVFTSEELYQLWLVDNYIYWVENSPVTVQDYPLMDSMLAKMTEAITGGGKSVFLRFGHDSCSSFLLMHLGIGGRGAIPASAEDLPSVFRNYDVRMGCQIQFVLYSPKKDKTIDPDKVLVKVLLNGEESTLPLDAVSGPYYRWNDFKALMARRDQGARIK